MTTDSPTDAASLAWMARRGVAPQWRAFLRALVETLDTNLAPESRDSLLRAVGARLAGTAPLPPCDSLEDLSAAMNRALLGWDWGHVAVTADGAASALYLTHRCAPAVGCEGDAEGAWIGAVLEGLFTAWIAGQPGADSSLPARVTAAAAGRIELRYGRG
jgi:hypothetical protein